MDAADHIQQQDPGDASGEAIPVPIPNTEVKLSSAEDTERAAFRENRSSPGSCAFRRFAGGYAAAVTLPGTEDALSTRSSDEQSGADNGNGPRGCPFLVAESGGWRLDLPSKDHRCTAVSPVAVLSLEKQSRLCLTAAFPRCATYLASLEARDSRLGPIASAPATRWRLTRTTAVIEDAGGLRSRVVGSLTDRSRWPAVPAVLLLTGLIVLGLSGLRGTPASAVASPSPSQQGASATATAGASPAPTEAPPTEAPTAAPTTPSLAPTTKPPATAKPVPTFRTYTVKSGDSLSAIASKFGTTSRAIADLNGIKVTTTLHIGQVLKIPNP